MPEVRLIPLGVGDAFTARHYTTSLALGVDDRWLLIDCPHPIRRMWREASSSALGVALDLDKISGVVITHLHADHASGLEDFAYYAHYALKTRPTWLAHPDVSAKLWDGLLSGGMCEMCLQPGEPPVRRSLDDYVDLLPLDFAKPVSLGPFTIETRPTQHSVPTTALRIHAGGRTFGFSADSAHDPGLIDWLSSADLIVHEATDLDDSTVHTPYRHLAALPEALRAKIRLTHLPDDFDPGPFVIEPLREGRCYKV